MYGLLTDDMGIYKKDKNGNLKYTFQYADVPVAQGVLDALCFDKGTRGKTIVESITTLPNPVTSSAEIQMSLKESTHANVAVFNILGEEVASYI